MFVHIRRHQKWLWIVIAGLTIISFVYFLDPTTGRRSRGATIFGGRSAQFGTIEGHAVTAEEFGQAQDEAKLQYFMMSMGRWPDEDESSRQFFNLEQQTGQRLFLLKKARDLGIRASDEAVADWIADYFRDRKTGAFKAETYQAFVTKALPRGRMTESEFLTFVRHQVVIQQMFSVVAMAGSLLSPREAEEAYRRENQQWVTEAVLFPSTNYAAGVQVTPEGLGQYFTNFMSQYRIPERVQVAYVKFPATNHLAEADQQLAQVTNLTQRLEAIYQQQGAEFYQDAEGKPLAHDAALEKIKEQSRQEIALGAARKKAQEFMEQLYDLYQKQPKQLDNLEKMAAATGNLSAVTEPFTGQEGPRELKVPATFAQAAFRLSAAEPMATEPVVAEDGVYVIALKKRIPSEVPSLDAVRDRVTADFRRREALEAAHKAGQAFYNQLTNGLAQGKTFQAVCLEANVITYKLPPVSLTTKSLPKEWEGKIDLSLIKDVAATLSPGQTSPFEPTRDGGLILNLVSRLPADETRMKSELPAFTENLRAQRHQEALNSWYVKEFELAHVSGGPWEKKTGAQ